VFICASSDCFPELSLEGVMQRLVDLEYTSVEVVISDKANQVRPSDLLANLEQVTYACRQTQRLDVAAYLFDGPLDTPEYFPQFEACCRLAKGTKVVTITVPAAELGTPFNGEIERLRELVRIASQSGINVCLLTEAGKMTQDPTTAVSMCENVKGLKITLDPSAYVCGPLQGGNYDQVFKYVAHVHFRDTSKTKPQVRIGQGEVEYGKIHGQLLKLGYDRALSARIFPMEGIDQNGELRKLRLLLDSLL
jgi:sugar phosphate isomerase/epimerase